MSAADGNVGDVPLLGVRRHPAVEAANSSRFWTVRYYMLSMVLVSMYYAISETPVLLLYEIAICKAYYLVHDPTVIGPDGYIPEAKCKLKPIQADLTMIHADQKQFNFIASFVASFYTAIFVKLFGRRRVLMLNIACHICAQIWIYSCLGFSHLPIRFTYISSCFLLVASGPEMRNVIFAMIIADTTPEEYRFTIYTLEQIFVHPVFFGAKKIAAKLMRYTPWTPLVLGIVTLLIVIMILCFLSTDQKPASGGIIHDQDSETNSSASDQMQMLWKRIKTTEWKKTSQQRKKLFTIALILATFPATSLYGHLMSGPVFVQYVEERFGVDLARASEIQANIEWINMGGLIMIVVAFGRLNAICLELFGTSLGTCLLYIVSRIKGIQLQDITISCFCALLSASGFLVMGLPGSYGNVVTGLFLCAGGQAFRMAAKSTLIVMARDPSKDSVTGLFTLIYYIDLAGGSFNTWLLAASFKKGMSVGGQWKGLPFYAAAILWTVVTIIICIVRLFWLGDKEGLDSPMIQNRESQPLLEEFPPELPENSESNIR